MIGQEETSLNCIKKGLYWVLGKFPYRKGRQALEQTAQESGLVTIPGLCKGRADVSLRDMV